MYGAGDGIRTRDIDLGKVALYQLSYSRLKRNLDSLLAKAGVSNQAVKTMLTDHRAWSQQEAYGIRRSARGETRRNRFCAPCFTMKFPTFQLHDSCRFCVRLVLFAAWRPCSDRCTASSKSRERSGWGEGPACKELRLPEGMCCLCEWGKSKSVGSDPGKTREDLKRRKF